MSDAVEPERVLRAVTARGFRVFAAFDSSVERYGVHSKVEVVESSLAGKGAHVRVYETDPLGRDGVAGGHVQLSVPDALEVIRALAVFVQEACSDQLTELAEFGPEEGEDDE